MRCRHIHNGIHTRIQESVEERFGIRHDVHVHFHVHVLKEEPPFRQFPQQPQLLRGEHAQTLRRHHGLRHGGVHQHLQHLIRAQPLQLTKHTATAAIAVVPLGRR